MQMAAGRALHYAGQLVRRRGKHVTISLPSATTARDLQPARPGDTRSNTSHRDIARNNSLKLQQLGTHVTINVTTAAPAHRLQLDIVLKPTSAFTLRCTPPLRSKTIAGLAELLLSSLDPGSH